MNGLDVAVRTDRSQQPSPADQALQWFVLLQSGDATTVDRRRFLSWLETDATHGREFDKLSELWADLDSTKPLWHDALARAAADWATATQRGASRSVTSWSVSWASVAVALLVIVIGGIWFGQPEVMEYRTAKGERRTVALSDGSTVAMNTDTTITTEFSAAHRLVALREGEALFAVSHDTDRPFEVAAGHGVVRDVGTKFVIRKQDESVTVTVVEGAVEVQHRGKAEPLEPWRLLTVGEQVSYAQQGLLSPVKKVSLTVSTAWVEGKVIFEDRPLAEVIQEIGRYHAGEIRILDASVGALKVSGVFGVHDREGFLEALERAVSVTASYVDGYLAVLEQKSGVSERR